MIRIVCKSFSCLGKRGTSSLPGFVCSPSKEIQVFRPPLEGAIERLQNPLDQHFKRMYEGAPMDALQERLMSRQDGRDYVLEQMQKSSAELKELQEKIGRLKGDVSFYGRLLHEDNREIQWIKDEIYKHGVLGENRGLNCEKNLSAVSDDQLQKMYRNNNRLIEKLNKLKEDKSVKEGERSSCANQLRLLESERKTIEGEIRKRGMIFSPTSSSEEKPFEEPGLSMRAMISVLFSMMFIFAYQKRRFACFSLFAIAMYSAVLFVFRKVFLDLCNMIEGRFYVDNRERGESFRKVKRQIEQLLNQLDKENKRLPLTKLQMEELQQQINRILDGIRTK